MAAQGSVTRHWRYPGAVGACALTTLITLPMLDAIDPANIILLFVLAVTAVAALWGRGPAALASFLSVACFNFFFVAPRFSFSVSNAEYLITFAVMLLVSLLISYLSKAYRQKALEAEQRAGEAGRLHELAQSLSGALTLPQVSEFLNAFMQQRFASAAALFVPGVDEHLHAVGVNNINLVERTAAQGVYVNGQITGPVADLHAEMRTMLLPLNGATRRRGVVAVYLGDGTPEIETSLLAAIAALVATAVERIHYVEVAQASELAAQSERLRNSILSAISHDIRTPLTVMFGLADTLANTSLVGTDLPPAQRDSATALRDQAQRLHRMVDNLLDMARLKSGKVQLVTDWQSLPEIVAASVQSLGTAVQRNVLRLDWPDDLPLLRMDAVLMERVFANLFENALKYSPEASVIAIGAAAEGERLSVWMDNAGAGFPPDRLPHVFGLFERGATETHVPGVGLGLSICRTIVEAHGGSIVASNRIGGARVHISLPLSPVPAVPAEDEDGHD